MSLSVKFNGIELNQYIAVTQGFTPFIGANWDPELNTSAGLARGADFKYTTHKEKIIPMPFQMRYDLEEKYDELEGILNVNEPKELIFGNMPGKVFYAIPSGTLDFEEIVFLGSGEINWIVPDGLAHSTVEKVFPASLNSNGIMEATIVNNGTAEVPISYQITHNHENGYVGIVSEYGAMQYGYVDELDKEIRTKSQVLVNYSKASDFNAMTNGGGILTDNFPTNGTWATYYDYLALGGVGSGTTWHGASKTMTIPADSSGASGAQNFLAQARVWFETGTVAQTGILQFVVGDENGNHLASMHIMKDSTTNNTARVITQVQLKEINRIYYEPNSKSVTNQANGWISITKTGELFNFYFGGKTYSVRVPAAASRKGLTLTIFLGQYGTRGSGSLVHRMYFKNLVFQKNNVNYWYDIPNRYRNGSVLYIDGETTKAYVDGIPSEEITGSDYFLAPPGTTKVQFYYSDFSAPAPTIEARIREAYL
ncbi:distal tail protein Dit [Faecalicatena contorta]|uniref:Putative phage tail component, N-terminal domain-containing protein n=1 Tax=Faecalicatena contorta TaxID=39482 RepID=A0A315ZWV9_9FIRM|nr:distal tail protein Dit [Faecalicatena contorta]PWJ49358.1 putative phage tail component-like protein [Faecalicatena contorta]SUQ14602.1 putative phage tail component, N-terminal domain-containing protein [Faecalicatena contorta]